MAGVFLSYDRDDTDKARPIALALEKAGHEVWWDLHVRGGAQFSKVIEEALKAANVVVVLWSRNSIESPWVRDEAAAGRDTGRLVPVTIDGTQPPLGFRQFQTLDLSRWKGRGTPPALRTLLADVGAMAGAAEHVSTAPDVAPSRGQTVTRDGGLRHKRRLIGPAAILAAAAVLIGLVLLRPWQTRSSNPTVAVAAADASPLSADMARNLLVKLGSLQANAVETVHLADDIGAKPADIRVMVNGTREGSLIRANVSLAARASKTMLWSKDLENAASDRSALDDAVASAAGRAVRCARDEASGEYGHLDEDLLRTYVNACVALTEAFGDADSLVPQLRQVTEKAPKFRPAWARLLTAEGDYLSALGVDEDASAARRTLANDIVAARKVDPRMAEATLAEANVRTDLTPEQAIDLVDRAKSQDPRNPLVLVARTFELARVGRMADALDDADAAARLDPISPVTRATQVLAILFAGKLDRARIELAAARRLWPDAAPLRQVAYTMDLRYGDFEKASRDIGYIGPGFEVYANLRRHRDDAAALAAYMAFMRRPENRGRMFFALQGLGETNHPNEFYQLIAEVGDEAVALDRSMLFRPWMASVRRAPRFMTLAKRFGLVDYWQKSGRWPDFCADAELKYDCRTEAAKLR